MGVPKTENIVTTSCFRLSYQQGCWAVPGDAQNAFELPVDGAKELCLVWQLPLDVWSREDVLQVQPLLLALQPLIQSVTQQPQGLAHFVHIPTHTCTSGTVVFHARGGGGREGGGGGREASWWYESIERRNAARFGGEPERTDYASRYKEVLMVNPSGPCCNTSTFRLTVQRACTDQAQAIASPQTKSASDACLVR